MVAPGVFRGHRRVLPECSLTLSGHFSTRFSDFFGKCSRKFSEYFALVYEVLKQLNFETNVFCSSDALFPRNKSVIQVGCLKKVAEGWDDQVQVCNKLVVALLILLV